MTKTNAYTLPDGVDLAEVDAIVARRGTARRALIPILQAIQNVHSYLPPEALQRVAETTQSSPADVTSVATFYTQFRTEPAGRHTIRVCIGTACHVKGAQNVFDSFKKHLGIPEDQDTDSDRTFTVEKVACLGCCMLAPAVQIDDLTYGHLSPAKVPGVLRDFFESLAREGLAVGAREIDGPPVGEVRMCLCSSCIASGAGEVYARFRDEIASDALDVALKVVGCTGISYQTPLVEIATNGHEVRYGRLESDNVPQVLARHFRPRGLSAAFTRGAYSLLEKLYTDEAWEPVTRFCLDVRDGADAAYSARQLRIATEHCGHMDPLDIDDYLRRDGFAALRKALSLPPGDLIEMIVDSGLRGRGGAGFPTGWKWATVRKATGNRKYLICNGDEGDPGAFMDRMILESFPFRVIEGACVAAVAVGAEEGFFYVRAEYPLAAKRLREALRICRERGILGDGNLSGGGDGGGGRRLDLTVVEGAGAFVCGEETALIAAVEGNRGTPSFRPPYPSERGLWGEPTLVNNVETLAVIPWIIRNGPEAFEKIGTHSSRGTKAFALAGKIEHGGLIEVPMGVTLREIVEDIGGGVQDGKVLKAVQVGGPSGGCVPAHLADTPVDYEELQSVGAIMGSGGMVVLDETDCMVEVARYFLAFTQLESCGKCTFCRVGTKRMLEILERLCEGRGRKGDIAEIENLAGAIKAGSLCGLGRTAPNPVLSTLRFFRDEYEAHIEGRCPAKKCVDLIAYSITDKCIGCTRCAQNCPVDAIAPRPYQQHDIDDDKCTRCDTCKQVCPADAVEVIDKKELSSA